MQLGNPFTCGQNHLWERQIGVLKAKVKKTKYTQVYGEDQSFEGEASDLTDRRTEWV
jgi:hypothetical protein